MSAGEVQSEAYDGREVPLCPGCLNENPEMAPFCHRCGMPVGMIATLDPIQWIYSMGWGLRRAISGGRWPLALLGVWLCLGPMALVLTHNLASVVRARYVLNSVPDLVAFMSTVVCVGLVVGILYRVTAAYIRHLRYKPGTCQTCGYSLANLTEPRCPECGTGFDPERLPDEFAWEARLDWTPPDVSGVSEVDFPVDCDACRYNLRGLGDEGRCPECGTAFDRRERLFTVHGPEAFCADMPTWKRPARRTRSVRRAIFVTALALVSVPVIDALSSVGVISPECRVFVVLLFVAAIVEWIQAGRQEPPATQSGEESPGG